MYIDEERLADIEQCKIVCPVLPSILLFWLKLRLNRKFLRSILWGLNIGGTFSSKCQTAWKMGRSWRFWMIWRTLFAVSSERFAMSSGIHGSLYDRLSLTLSSKWSFDNTCLLSLNKGVRIWKKKTVGRLNIFVHQCWTYLPPCDLYDVILPNIGLFSHFLAHFLCKSTCIMDIPTYWAQFAPYRTRTSKVVQ